MPFEVFDAYGAAARPEVTLRASGQLFVSRGILKRSGREDATLYQLQFDEDTDRLAIKMCRNYDKLNEQGVREAIREKSGIAINVLPLLRYYNLQVPKQKVVFPVGFENGGLVIVDLKGLRGRPDGSKQAAASKEQPTTGTRSEEFDDDIPF